MTVKEKINKFNRLTTEERSIYKLELENKKLRKALTNAEVKNFSLIHLKDKTHEAK